MTKATASDLPWKLFLQHPILLMSSFSPLPGKNIFSQTYVTFPLQGDPQHLPWRVAGSGGSQGGGGARHQDQARPRDEAP